MAAAKRNNFSALKPSGNSPSEYARSMHISGKYHSWDIRQWTSEGREQEECGFHPMLVCSCGKCREKKSSETVANTEKGADDESEEGEEESDGRETGNSKSDIKTESEENKESSSIPS